MVITNSGGAEVARLEGGTTAGIHTVVWTMRPQRGRGGRPAAAGSVLDRLAPLGDYTVRLEVGGETLFRTARVTKTQGWSIGTSPQIIR